MVELEHQKDLLKVVEDSEAELRQKDHHLAVVEARLCQLRIQIENGKWSNPKGILDVVPEEVPKMPVLGYAYVEYVGRACCAGRELSLTFGCVMVFLQAFPEKVYQIAVVGAQEVDIKNAISSACTEVEKLADQVAEVRKQMMESDDSYDNGLEELIAQATAVSHSGKKLSLLRNAISVEELNDIKLTLFRDHQPASVHLESSSPTLQNPPSGNLESAMEHETLHPPPVQVDEASTSGPLPSLCALL